MKTLEEHNIESRPVWKPILMVGECVQNPVRESGAGLVAPTLDELPGIIWNMLEMGAKSRREMGLKGVEYAKAHYDWESLAQRLFLRLKETKVD